MFADSTADAFFNINERPLQPNLNFDIGTLWGHFQRFLLRGEFNRIFGVCRDFSSPAFFYSTIIITGSKLVRRQAAFGGLNYIVFCVLDRQHAIPHGFEEFAGIYRLWADGAVLFTHDAGFVHRPRQTSGAVNKSCPYPYWPDVGEFIASKFFRKGYRPDSRGRTNLPAGNAIQLTAAGTNSIVQDRCPEVFQSALNSAWLDDIGGANPHALAALDTALQEIPLSQCTGRPNELMIPVGAKFITQPEGLHAEDTAGKRKYKAPAGNIGVRFFARQGRLRLVGNYFVPAILAAVKTEYTLADSYPAARLASAFAGFLTQFAVAARLLHLANPPHGEPADYAEQRAQRTDEPAIESGDNQVEQERCGEYREYEPCAFVEAARN
jgi:hypothetical protein